MGSRSNWIIEIIQNTNLQRSILIFDCFILIIKNSILNPVDELTYGNLQQDFDLRLLVVGRYS